jgi:flagellar biosynthetic protein FliP
MKILRFFLFVSLTYFCSDSLYAQSVTLDLGQMNGSAIARLLQLLLGLTVLTLAPSILVMVTSFTRLVIVFSFLRSALGLQQSPPNSVLISLSLFLSIFIMSPVLEKSYQEGIQPLLEERINEKEGIEKAAAPFHSFMRAQIREKDLVLFLELSKTPLPSSLEDIPFKVLIPAFMMNELRRAFQIGFLIFIPFLVIDMVVASIVMSMGMMMLPTTMIALPFKLIFFVLIDGWSLICGSLVNSFRV